MPAPPPPEPGSLPEEWKPMKARLSEELRYNPLDFENPPNPIDNGHPDFVSHIEWDIAGPDLKNSTALLNCIKKWEMELPNM